jgi:Flp pilus assembly protein TadD
VPPEQHLSPRCALCVNAAILRVLKGDLDEAERLLGIALEITPDSPHAIRMLVYLYLQRGDLDKARRLLKTSR